MQSIPDRAETLFSLVVATFLVVTGALVIVGTVSDSVGGLGEDPLLTVALRLGEESLLLFTLRLVLTGGVLSGEPFLFIGPG